MLNVNGFQGVFFMSKPSEELMELIAEAKELSAYIAT
jgi:hypothetical protein